MKREKILIAITKSYFGGAQRYVFDLATSLPKDKYEVLVLLGGIGTLKTKLENVDIRVTAVSNLDRDIKVTSDIAAFLSFLKIFWQKKPDIVHLNSSKVGGVGALAGRLTGVPKIIFTAHGWAFNEDRHFISKIFLKLLYWIIILLSHKTIIVSEAMKRQVISWPFIGRKISVIYNGINAPDFFEKNKAKEKLSAIFPPLKNRLKLKPLVIGTISELHKVKGLSFAMQAIKAVREHNIDAIFLIIGEGEERFFLEKLISELNLNNNVFLFGYLDSAPLYLKAFDLFTLTSTSEALSYTLLEAGSAELPVVASNIGGIPEIIEQEKTGLLVPPRDYSAIAKAIERLIGDKIFSEKLGQALREKVSKLFSREEMIKKTLAEY